MKLENHLRKRVKSFDEITFRAKEAMVLMTIRELGIFTILRQGNMDCESLAKKCEVGPERLKKYLDFVVELGFLTTCENNQYSLIPGDNELFDPEGPWVKMIGFQSTSDFFATLGQGTSVLKKNEPIVSAGPGGDVSIEERRSFLSFLDSRSCGVAREVAEILSNEKFSKIADLGCGAGTYSYSLLKKCSGAQAVLVDRPNAESIVMEFAQKAGQAKCVQFKGVDFMKDDFGSDFDIILLSNLVHCYGPKENADLIKKLAPKLKGGGRLVIKDFYVDSLRKGPKSALSFSITMACFTQAGDVYSMAEIESWAKPSGLILESMFMLEEAPESAIYILRKP